MTIYHELHRWSKGDRRASGCELHYICSQCRVVSVAAKPIHPPLCICGDGLALRLRISREVQDLHWLVWQRCYNDLVKITLPRINTTSQLCVRLLLNTSLGACWWFGKAFFLAVLFFFKTDRRGNRVTQSLKNYFRFLNYCLARKSFVFRNGHLD